MHGYHHGTLFYDPGPPPVSRGQLLSGVRRQQEDQGHSDKQGENKFPHGCALLFRLRRADAFGQRAAVFDAYS